MKLKSINTKMQVVLREISSPDPYDWPCLQVTINTKMQLVLRGISSPDPYDWPCLQVAFRRDLIINVVRKNNFPSNIDTPQNHIYKY